MVTVFIVISGENWNEIAAKFSKDNHFYQIYFVALVIIGNFMLLNLFLAILLKYIDLDNIWKKKEIEEKATEDVLKTMRKF